MNDVRTWSNPYSGITVFRHRALLKKKNPVKTGVGLGAWNGGNEKHKTPLTKSSLYLKKKKKVVSVASKWIWQFF